MEADVWLFFYEIFSLNFSVSLFTLTGKDFFFFRSLSLAVLTVPAAVTPIPHLPGCLLPLRGVHCAPRGPGPPCLSACHRPTLAKRKAERKDMCGREVTSQQGLGRWAAPRTLRLCHSASPAGSSCERLTKCRGKEDAGFIAEGPVWGRGHGRPDPDARPPSPTVALGGSSRPSTPFPRPSLAFCWRSSSGLGDPWGAAASSCS